MGTGLVTTGTGLVTAGTGLVTTGTGLVTTGTGLVTAGTDLVTTSTGLVTAGTDLVTTGTGLVTAGTGLVPGESLGILRSTKKSTLMDRGGLYQATPVLCFCSLTFDHRNPVREIALFSLGFASRRRSYPDT